MEGILVGVDESTNTEQALRWAVEHGAVRHQPVTALMAWNTGTRRESGDEGDMMCFVGRSGRRGLSIHRLH
jgi:nucleotide-binding universal stress UspA family protein